MRPSQSVHQDSSNFGYAGQYAPRNGEINSYRPENFPRNSYPPRPSVPNFRLPPPPLFPNFRSPPPPRVPDFRLLSPSVPNFQSPPPRVPDFRLPPPRIDPTFNANRLYPLVKNAHRPTLKENFCHFNSRSASQFPPTEPHTIHPGPPNHPLFNKHNDLSSDVQNVGLQQFPMENLSETSVSSGFDGKHSQSKQPELTDLHGELINSRTMCQKVIVPVQQSSIANNVLEGSKDEKYEGIQYEDQCRQIPCSKIITDYRNRTNQFFNSEKEYYEKNFPKYNVSEKKEGNVLRNKKNSYDKRKRSKSPEEKSYKNVPNKILPDRNNRFSPTRNRQLSPEGSYRYSSSKHASRRRSPDRSRRISPDLSRPHSPKSCPISPKRYHKSSPERSHRASRKESHQTSPKRSHHLSPKRSYQALPKRSHRDSQERNHRTSPLRNHRHSPERNRRTSPARNHRHSPERNRRTSPARNHRHSPERNHRISSRNRHTSVDKHCRKSTEKTQDHSKQRHTEHNSLSSDKCTQRFPVSEASSHINSSKRKHASKTKTSSSDQKTERTSGNSATSKGSENSTSVAKCTWIRSSPAELYYVRDENNPKILIATDKLKELHNAFKYELVERAERIKQTKPKYEPPQRKTKLRKPKPPKAENEDSSSVSEESSSEEEDTALEELERKKKHPDRLHEELWYNDPGEMNDGPLCRCSAKARRSGIRHGIYAGETSILLCDPYSNNADKLYHYTIMMTPNTNFLSKCPTTIHHDGHDFIFEGFSILSHFEIPDLPSCKVIRFNIEYTIKYVQEKCPENFTINGLELCTRYLFTEILELVDLSWKAHDDSTGCPRFHLMPRFSRDIEGSGKELLSINVVLQYLQKNNQLLIQSENLNRVMALSQHKWQDFADSVKGMIVTCPGMKPSSIRVDQLDRESCDPEKNIYPEIIHFGVRPPQLSYAGNPNYQKAWRDYVKFRHLLANKPKVIYADRHRLLQKERRLQEMRMKNNLKRDVTVVISSEKFYKTGIMCDVVQHAMLLPVLICHLRFHQSLNDLEEKIGYKFRKRYLLQLALTHPSYRENFGTNPDHARNSLTNCGIRQPEYGDRRIHYMNTRKRGINTLINIMSRFGRREDTASRINHNERLEFLGDAVVEFLSSIHLFFMFPNLEEGGLATYRAAIVQNQHLAVLAKKLQLEKFMLYAHGSDLCHDLELRHAMANCFEALMGALFLDSGIEVADRVFSETLFEGVYLEEWVNYPPHPLQEQEPGGDRKWIASVPILQKLSKFEEATGLEFTHIRLLARAMTHRSLGFNNLTLGSNQRLEFLGDTVLQLVASEYLYRHFPEHHEGHLSLLRSSLVNNRTQAVVCDDLGMVEYAIYPYSKVELKAKDRADLLEAFLGALYVDKDLGYCNKFCEVCFFPRLQDFIMNQEWNDPKSKLQQCCLTLRTMDGGEPDIPVYKVIECKGPTNTRVYTVAVYFRRRRLAVGSGHSIQQAEMAAAENALDSSKDLFPQLDHQRRAIEKSLNQRIPSRMLLKS